MHLEGTGREPADPEPKVHQVRFILKGVMHSILPYHDDNQRPCVLPQLQLNRRMQKQAAFSELQPMKCTSHKTLTANLTLVRDPRDL